MTGILRNIISMARRYKTATAMNLIGLIVAFAAFYLIMTQIIYQVTFNRGIQDHQRIYRLEMTGFDFAKVQWNTSMPAYIEDELLKRPGVESVSLVSNDWSWSTYVFKKGDEQVVYPAVMGNNTAISTLTDKVVDGSIEWTENDHSGVIIPASIALQYFGTTKATGKKLLGFGGGELLVRGVYQDFPETAFPATASYSPFSKRRLRVPRIFSCIMYALSRPRND